MYKLFRFAAIAVVVVLMCVNTASAFNLVKLYDDLNAIPYDPSNYTPNVFDCSNMGALLYDYLKHKGYGVKFVLVKSYRYPYLYHVFLIVYDRNETKNPVSGMLCTSDGCTITLRKNCYWIDPVTLSVSDDVKPILDFLYKIYDFRTFYIYNDYNCTGFPASEFKY